MLRGNSVPETRWPTLIVLVTDANRCTTGPPSSTEVNGTELCEDTYIYIPDSLTRSLGDKDEDDNHEHQHQKQDACADHAHYEHLLLRETFGGRPNVVIWRQWNADSISGTDRRTDGQTKA